MWQFRINLGDFNFPKISWPKIQLQDNDSSAVLFADMLLYTNLEQLVPFPTRYRLSQTPSLIDLILTGDPNLLGEINQSPPIGISDHCVIETSIQYYVEASNKYETLEISKINFDNLNFDLLNTNWRPLL